MTDPRRPAVTDPTTSDDLLTKAANLTRRLGVDPILKGVIRDLVAEVERLRAAQANARWDIEALEALVSDVRSSMAEAWERGDFGVPLDDLAMTLGGPLSAAAGPTADTPTTSTETTT